MDINTIQSIWSKLHVRVSKLSEIKTLQDYSYQTPFGCTNVKNEPDPKNDCFLNITSVNVNFENPQQAPAFQPSGTSYYILPITYSNLALSGKCSTNCKERPLSFDFTPDYFNGTKPNGRLQILINWTGTNLNFISIQKISVVKTGWGYADGGQDGGGFFCSQLGDYMTCVPLFANAHIDQLLEPFYARILERLDISKIS